MVGYVNELKKDLFSLTKSELKVVAEKYQAKVPASLSSQLTDRANKKQAVDKYQERKDREATKLHPAGKFWIQYYFISHIETTF